MRQLVSKRYDRWQKQDCAWRWSRAQTCSQCVSSIAGLDMIMNDILSYKKAVSGVANRRSNAPGQYRVSSAIRDLFPATSTLPNKRSLSLRGRVHEKGSAHDYSN